MTVGAGPVRRFLRWCWADIRSGQTIDLWLLVAASITFTVLGATGVASVQVLSSIVLALLALLALSQIRGRQEVNGLVSSWRQSRTELFQDHFPKIYYEVRSRASRSYSYAGTTMARTLPTILADLERILENGGRVRILLPDPERLPLMQMVAISRCRGETADDVAEKIRQSIAAARKVRNRVNGSLEVRLSPLLPRLSMNIFDAGQPGAFLMVQMYQAKAEKEPAPIFALTPEDEKWFDHFLQEFEALWNLEQPLMSNERRAVDLSETNGRGGGI